MISRFPYTTFLLRRDESNVWTEKNPVLGSGEPGFEIDTNKLKIGNGIDDWNTLDYIAGGGGGGGGGSADFNTSLVAGSGITFIYNSGNSTLTINSSGVGGGSGNCCNPFDQDLNTYNYPTFSGVSLSNNTSLAQGTYDNGLGGSGGISLNCAVGYELNWQAGHLKNTYNDGVNGIQTGPILCDSPISLPGTGLAYMRVDNSGITFSDNTRQITAYTGCLSTAGGNNLSPYTSGVGAYSIIPVSGHNIASGLYSNVAGGKDARASLYGEEARAAGKFVTAGDAQVRKFVLRTSTDGVTQTINGVTYYPLLLDGGENNSVLQRIQVPSDASWYYTIKVIARQDNSGNSAAYDFKGTLKVYELYGASLMPYLETILYEDNPDWHVYIRTLSETNELDIYARVPDDSAGVVYWVAYVEAVQVIAPPPPDVPPPPPPSSSSSESSSSESGSSSSAVGSSSSAVDSSSSAVDSSSSAAGSSSSAAGSSSSAVDSSSSAVGSSSSAVDSSSSAVGSSSSS